MIHKEVLVVLILQKFGGHGTLRFLVGLLFRFLLLGFLFVALLVFILLFVKDTGLLEFLLLGGLEVCVLGCRSVLGIMICRRLQGHNRSRKGVVVKRRRKHVLIDLFVILILRRGCKDRNLRVFNIEFDLKLKLGLLELLTQPL